MYSNWQDKTTERSIENLIEKIRRAKEHKEVGSDPFDKSKLLYEVNFAFEEIQTITINEIDIMYTYLRYRYETVKKTEQRNPVREKRIKLYEADIIIYQYKGKIYYIINKGFTKSTLTNLRNLLNYEGKGEIEEERTLGIKTDFFIWMIHYLIDSPEAFLDPEESTKIISVVGFKGERADRLAEINGSGEKIMEMLTTLLFLFENKSISKVEATILRNNEFFKLTLGNNIIDIDLPSYQGKESIQTEWNIKSRVPIKIFVDLLPNLVTIYSNELDTKIWSDNKEKQFFKNIGRKISKEINQRLKNNKK